MKNLRPARPLAAILAATLLLAGCGGGGGGGDASTPASSRFGPSSAYAGMCELEDQKRFVRSYLDEVYLWYDEIPEVDSAQYGNVPDYFNALRVRTPDANGLPKDRFSAVLPTTFASAQLQQSFVRSDHSGTVPLTRVVTSPGGRRVGYIQFNDHEVGAQDDLIAAFRQVRDGGAQDLALDLRFNSGGFLYIALAAASMVVGPAAEGRVFEHLRYNDKREGLSQASVFTFSSQVQFAESQNPKGSALPQLDLPRLYVLTSNLTCSASESIINSLRGIDVQVILVGDTTCGKPYGFTRRDNCGFAYFPIEFNGVNAKGFGGYTAGFQPTCRVADNNTASGGPGDPLLAAALVHADTGACPAGTATGVQSALQPSVRPAAPARPPWAGRLLQFPG
jgi:hypothetical protein